LGWVYFQQGDSARAEPFVRAAWLLGEERIVAEHLGEIYEKESKIQQAAHAYESALAVSSTPSLLRGSSPAEAESHLNEEMKIRARYKKLTGNDANLYETYRQPNGEWSQTPAEKLRHSREIKLSNESKLSGKAQFIVSLDPHGVDSADFENGDDALRPLESKLGKAHYPIEFPPDSDATIVLRVAIECRPASACVAAPMVPTMGTAPSSVAALQ
jgi:hypothetical protein